MPKLTPLTQKIIYSVLAVLLLTLSFFTGRLSSQIEIQQQDKPLKVIEDLDAPGTLEDLLELIKKDHSEPCPVCECETCAISTETPNNPSSSPLHGGGELNGGGELTEGGELDVDGNQGPYVASKSSSSKKFHPSDSSTAKRIKDENKVYFQSKEEAIAAGYTAGSSVK